MWNCGQRARSRGNSRDAGKDGENAPVPLKAARSRMRPENSWQSQRTRVVIEGGDAGLVRYACRRVAALPLHGQCPHARAGTLASQQVALAGCVQQHCARTLISGTARARAISAPDDGFAPCLRRVVFCSLCGVHLSKMETAALTAELDFDASPPPPLETRPVRFGAWVRPAGWPAFLALTARPRAAEPAGACRASRTTNGWPCSAPCTPRNSSPGWSRKCLVTWWRTRTRRIEESRADRGFHS